MSEHEPGGVIHTYRAYDAMRFPMPHERPTGLATAAFDHLMAYGSLRELTDAELADAVEIDPRQIRGLGPSIESILALLEERKRRILETYEVETVRELARQRVKASAEEARPPAALQKRFDRAVREEQIADLERLWYQVDERGDFARHLVRLMDRLGDRYQVEALAAKYRFTGRRGMDVPKAIEIKDELEKIDQLIEQLRKAAKDAKILLIDLNSLAKFVSEETIDELEALQRQVQELLRHLAEEQGLHHDGRRFSLTPKAFRLFQSTLLDRIFSELKASRSGRHSLPVSGDGAVETQRTKPYEFGDSLANMDVAASMVNALVRQCLESNHAPELSRDPEQSHDPGQSRDRKGAGSIQTGAPSQSHSARLLTRAALFGQAPQSLTSTHVWSTSFPTREDDRANGAPRRIHLLPEDIEIHQTRNRPKCATVVCMDMSGSMRFGGQYINVKRMSLALHGLIRKEYPGDFVDFVEICSLPRRRHISELLSLLPRPVTIHEPVVRLRADMGDEHLAESDIPPHFTNIQQALRLSRQMLQVQDTPNRQIMLITDGLPTAHFEDRMLYLLYPPDRRTEAFTLREGLCCRAQGITINVFLLTGWAQTEEDVQFAHRLAEVTRGRVFFVAGRELERFVVWDYVSRRRQIVG